MKLRHALICAALLCGATAAHPVAADDNRPDWENPEVFAVGREPVRATAFPYPTAAMALTNNSISIDNPILAVEPKLAIVMGNEGDGLSCETIAKADYVVRIPMSHGVDSLNVAAAAAVAFWQLRAPQS